MTPTAATILFVGLLAHLSLLLQATALPDGATCGTLVSPVAAHCAATGKGDPARCCKALARWNAALCWCEPAAMTVLSSIAGNSYGFSARAAACKIARPFRPGPLTYHRYAAPARSTCPSTFASAAPSANDPRRKCTVPPARLRSWRLKTLRGLDSIRLRSARPADVAAFRKKLLRIVEPRVRFGSVGQIRLSSASDMAAYFMSRQQKFGCTAPLAPAWKRQRVFWRDASRASYEINTLGAAYSTRFVFVQFSPCSPRLRSVTFAESAFLDAQYEQYFYSKGPNDVVGQFDMPALKVCSKIASACRGSNFPYSSRAHCVATMRALKARKRVMCNRLSAPYVPQLALHGNSIACRITVAGMAKLDPKKYCPMIARNPSGFCAEGTCPRRLYADIFTAQNPRHVGSRGFFCNHSSGICKEAWP